MFRVLKYSVSVISILFQRTVDSITEYVQKYFVETIAVMLIVMFDLMNLPWNLLVLLFLVYIMSYQQKGTLK